MRLKPTVLQLRMLRYAGVYWPWSLTMLKWSCFAFRVGRCCPSRGSPRAINVPQRRPASLSPPPPLPLPAPFSLLFHPFLPFPFLWALMLNSCLKNRGLQMCLRRRISSVFCPICYIDKGLLAPTDLFPFHQLPLTIVAGFIARPTCIHREK